MLLASCKEETLGVYNELTPTEQQAIRDRAKQKCLSQNTSNYNRYKIKSAEVFTSSAYQREDGFYFEYKVNTEIKKKVDVRVWKQTNDDMYFYITDTVLSADSYFLKISKVENDDMISDLLIDHCETSPKKIYTASSSSSGPVSVTYEYDLPSAPNTDWFTDKYVFPFNELAYFASYRITRTMKTTDADDAEVSKTNYTSTFVAKAYDFTSDNYADTSKYAQKFCTIVEDTEAGHFRLTKKSTHLGYELSCAITVPAGWDLSI